MHQSIKGEARVYGTKHERKRIAREKRKGARNWLRANAWRLR